MSIHIRTPQEIAEKRGQETHPIVTKISKVIAEFMGANLDMTEYSFYLETDNEPRIKVYPAGEEDLLFAADIPDFSSLAGGYFVSLVVEGFLSKEWEAEASLIEDTNIYLVKITAPDADHVIEIDGTDSSAEE